MKSQSTKEKSSNSSKSIKKQLKQRGISNSGGQSASQTDSKQSTINKGQQNPLVQGKNKAARLPSKNSPK